MKIFYSETFKIEFYFNSSWVLFHQFQLDKKPLHIKMEVYERNSSHMLPLLQVMQLATGEEQLKCERKQIMKVIDSYVCGCCEEGRNNHWPFVMKNILSLQNNFAILTSRINSRGYIVPSTIYASCDGLMTQEAIEVWCTTACLAIFLLLKSIQVFLIYQ